MFAWNRDSRSRNKTWLTFEAVDDLRGFSTFEIRDLPEYMLSNALELMKKFFIQDEPLCRKTKLIDDPLSVSHYEMLWTQSFHQGMALGCFNTDSNELVGANFLAVISQNDPPCERNWPGRAFRFIEIKMTNGMVNQFDPFKTFGIERFLVGWGLAVSSNARNRGIATQFMKSRLIVMEALNIPYTVTVYSAMGSQRAAEKAGYKTYLETEYVCMHVNM